jgi:hypothetical protein
MTYIPQSDIANEGNVRKMKVTDSNAEEILMEILKQLRMINFHLSKITDMEIDEEEVE